MDAVPCEGTAGDWRKKKTPECIRGGESICGVIYESRGFGIGSLEMFDGFSRPTLGGENLRWVGVGELPGDPGGT